MLETFRFKGTNISVYKQEKNEKPRLLQHSKLAPLSLIRDDNGKLPKAIINCSYFTPKWVVGRNQGDLRNDTVDSEFCDLVFTKDGKYHYGRYKSWDYQENVVAGMSLATWLVKEGQACEDTSSFTEGKLTSRRPQTAIGILQDNTILLIVTGSISGYELRTFIMQHYPTIRFLGQCDGGGSSEMIVNGTIVAGLSEGRERPMWNGFALVETEEPKPEPSENINKFTVKEWCQYLEEKVWEDNEYKLGGIGRYDGKNGRQTFDCVGIFKSKLWNYPLEPSNYGVTYPDANVGMIKNRCTKLMPFDPNKMEAGMVVFMGTEHIGMVGDPKYFKNITNAQDCIYECTPAFANKVLRSSVEDRKAKCWDTMGYADFVIYDEQEKPQCDCEEMKQRIQGLVNQLVEANKEIEKRDIKIMQQEETLNKYRKIVKELNKVEG